MTRRKAVVLQRADPLIINIQVTGGEDDQKDLDEEDGSSTDYSSNDEKDDGVDPSIWMTMGTEEILHEADFVSTPLSR